MGLRLVPVLSHSAFHRPKTPLRAGELEELLGRNHSRLPRRLERRRGNADLLELPRRKTIWFHAEGLPGPQRSDAAARRGVAWLRWDQLSGQRPGVSELAAD